MPDLKQQPTELTVGFSFGRPNHDVGTAPSKRTVYVMGSAFRIIGGTSAGVYYRHTDHLGSTSVISDANGLKVPGSDVQYAPFGEMRSGELSALTDFGYTGQRVDRSTGGLMYYGARYYLPGLRRFISADSIVPGAGNPQAFNRYSYVSNNPLNYTDPSGHEPEPYSDEWWVARYYALQLWKYEDPGVNDTTNALVSAAMTGDSSALEGILESFGITVNFGQEEENFTFSSSEERHNFLMTTALSAVLIGTRIYNTIPGGVDGGISAAFRAVMGETHTVTITDWAINVDGICGDEIDDKPACNTGSKAGANIYILADAMRGSYGFPPLIILLHEFGHNFTGSLDGNTPTFNDDTEARFNFNAFVGNGSVVRDIYRNCLVLTDCVGSIATA